METSTQSFNAVIARDVADSIVEEESLHSLDSLIIRRACTIIGSCNNSIQLGVANKYLSFALKRVHISESSRMILHSFVYDCEIQFKVN